MLAKLVEHVFGCRHGNYTFPMTIKRGRNSGTHASRATYVVCLECGKELNYDWSTMKVVGNVAAANWSGVQELVAP
jgi:hypothetical protein